MNVTSCESSNLSDCKSVDEVDGEEDDAVYALRRAINIVAFLLMSVGMTCNFLDALASLDFTLVSE